MKITKYLFLLILLVCISGCSIKPQMSIPEKNSKSEINSEKKCKKEGGEWKEICSNPSWGGGCSLGCYLTYDDKDKACGDGSECKSGYCIIGNTNYSEAKYNEIVQNIKRIINQREGRCYGDNLSPDCLLYLTNGQISSYACSENL